MASSSFNQTLLPLGIMEAESYLWYLAGSPAVSDRLVWAACGDDPAAKLWQDKFLLVHTPMRAVLTKLLNHHAFADPDPMHVNHWFEKDGFPRMITEKPVDPDIFYVGMWYALQNLSWLGGRAEDYHQEEWIPLTITDKKLPAYRLSVAKNKVRFYNMNRGPRWPLVVIPTWDTLADARSPISIMCWPSHQVSEWELTRAAQYWTSLIDSTAVLDDYGGVILPHVSVTEELKLGEGKMKGLWTTAHNGRKVWVEDAGMYLHSVLCPDGPMSEGAAYVELNLEFSPSGASPKPDFVFDEPFIFAYVQMVDGKPVVITANWVDTDAFSATPIRLSDSTM